MSSRIRNNSKLFEVIVEARRGDGDLSFIKTELHFLHPAVHQDVLNSVSKFVFPFDEHFISPSVDCFTFVLTDGDGTFKFGFCRLSANSRICHCLVSYFPWFERFYDLLNKFVEMKKTHPPAYLVAWIDSLLVDRNFQPGDIITSGSLDPVIMFEVPDPHQLMTIPSSVNLIEYYCAIDARNMIEMFASTLLERRIIVTSKKLSRLTACIHCVSTLLFPFQWQHIYIPILPPHLLDYCSAPMPFLIGVHSSLWNKIRKEDLGDVLILDADDNSIYSSFNDTDKLPSPVVRKLKKQLMVSSKKKLHFEGGNISQAFLRTVAMLFGGYKSAFKTENQKIAFDNEIFVESRPGSFKPFLRYSLQLQIFQQFIEERLVLLNSYKEISDVFEEEIKALESKEKQKRDSHKLVDNTLSKMIKKAERSRFANFLENFMGGCSSNHESKVRPRPQKAQTPNLSKRIFSKIPRKMSANFVTSIPREFQDSKKQLSSSNSSDGFIQHTSPAGVMLQVDESAREFHQGRSNGASRDAVNWSEPVSSSSSFETVNLTSQDSLSSGHEDRSMARNKISQSFGDISNDNRNNSSYECHTLASNSTSNSCARFEVGEQIYLSVDAGKHLKAGNQKVAVKKVQGLIELYEGNVASKESALRMPASTSAFPGIYFPPHQVPSSIAARQADLQVATEQWKKNYMSRNVAEVSFGLSNIISKFPETCQVKETMGICGLMPTSVRSANIPKPIPRTDLTFDISSLSLTSENKCLGMPKKESSLETVPLYEEFSPNNRKLVTNQVSDSSRGLSSHGLSRRLAFKVNKSQSSTESQRDSVLQSLKNSLRESLEITVKKDDQKYFPSPGIYCNTNGDDDDDDDNYSTPPLPLSSPPTDNDNCNDPSIYEYPHFSECQKLLVPVKDERKCLTLCLNNIHHRNEFSTDDNMSLPSTASSYSSFMSPECNGDAKHYTLPSNSLSTNKGIYAPMLFRKGKSNDP